MIGVYKITNPKGKVYIGASIDVKRRIYRHRCGKANGLPKLDRSLRKYGAESHKIEVIEFCEKQVLSERERYWQEHYNVLGENGLNLELVKTKFKPRKLSKQSKEKASMANKGRKQSHEEKKKRSESNRGRKRTPEQRERISKGLKGKKKSESHRLKAIKNLRPENGKLVLNLQTGIYYETAKEASETTIYSPDALRFQLRGVTKNKANFIYV